MRLSLAKWGNSIALRIPAQLLKELGANEGSLVEPKVENGRLILSPVTGRRRYTLDELVAGITDGNRHDVIDFGPPVGREVW